MTEKLVPTLVLANYGECEARAVAHLLDVQTDDQLDKICGQFGCTRDKLRELQADLEAHRGAD